MYMCSTVSWSGAETTTGTTRESTVSIRHCLRALEHEGEQEQRHAENQVKVIEIYRHKGIIRNFSETHDHQNMLEHEQNH